MNGRKAEVMRCGLIQSGKVKSGSGSLPGAGLRPPRPPTHTPPSHRRPGVRSHISGRGHRLAGRSVRRHLFLTRNVTSSARLKVPGCRRRPPLIRFCFFLGSGTLRGHVQFEHFRLNESALLISRQGEVKNQFIK